MSEIGAPDTIDLSLLPTMPEPNSIVVGVIVGFDADVGASVSFCGCPDEGGLVARSTAAIAPSDVGARVALAFENGDHDRPLILGKIHGLDHYSVNPSVLSPAVVQIDGERVKFSAEKEIVLECGKSSITLTRAGKIIIRGAYVSTGSSGVNKIKGASVQIN